VLSSISACTTEQRKLNRRQQRKRPGVWRSSAPTRRAPGTTARQREGISSTKARQRPAARPSNAVAREIVVCFVTAGRPASRLRKWQYPAGYASAPCASCSACRAMAFSHQRTATRPPNGEEWRVAARGSQPFTAFRSNASPACSAASKRRPQSARPWWCRRRAAWWWWLRGGGIGLS